MEGIKCDMSDVRKWKKILLKINDERAMTAEYEWDIN